MLSFRKLTQSAWIQQSVGTIAAAYLRLVRGTNSVVIEPADAYERFGSGTPLIIAFWHGQHFMVPFIQRPGFRGKVLISMHRDGEMQAAAVERLGIGTVRGSGSHDRDFRRKGGVTAFKEMVDTLASGVNMALTADVPKVSRVAGLGIIMLAKQSGRPIVPVGVTTSRAIQFNNWDHSTIGLPFGRCAIVAGEPLSVPARADDDLMRSLRAELEDRIEKATLRAYELVGRKDAGAKHG
jgi:hypothetical protein